MITNKYQFKTNYFNLVNEISDRISKNDSNECFSQEVLQNVNIQQNNLILTHGQTGSGKTFTLQGQNGLIFKLVYKLMLKFNFLKFSYVEIYNDQLQDLISDNQLNLIKTKPKQISYCYVYSYNQFIEQFGEFIKKRQTRATKFNLNSSRSHSILQLITNQSVFCIVDLAGNEKQLFENQEYKKESLFINKSLFSLSSMINNLSNNKIFTCRDSLLTRILSDYFVQKENVSQIHLILNVTQDNQFKILETLQFGRNIGAIKYKEVFYENNKHENTIQKRKKILQKEIQFLKTHTEEQTKQLCMQLCYKIKDLQ